PNSFAAIDLSQKVDYGSKRDRISSTTPAGEPAASSGPDPLLTLRSPQSRRVLEPEGGRAIEWPPLRFAERQKPTHS
ncbi:MAG: hypothetical protein WBL48_20690, partial [Pseudolabrys sp.]